MDRPAEVTGGGRCRLCSFKTEIQRALRSTNTAKSATNRHPSPARPTQLHEARKMLGVSPVETEPRREIVALFRAGAS